MSVENGEEALNSRHACAACKHQRKRCGNECVFAPHFPAIRADYFREVHKIFGVKNVTVILEHLSTEERKRAVESLEWEAFAWKEDPIEGPLGFFRKLENELELLKNQQNNIVVSYPTRSDLMGFNHNSSGIGANININATNFDYDPNYGLDVPVTNYARSYNNEIDNQGLDNYIGSHYPISQGQGRSGLDAVAQTTRGNQILPNSSMRPVVNSFNQRRYQRGSQGRVHTYFDGSVNGSQGRGFHNS
ncbi:hypothetical protein CRYUN_Cryun34aG0032900 [Craigia yunnanensis]